MRRRTSRTLGWLATLACGVLFAFALTWVTAPFHDDQRPHATITVDGGQRDTDRSEHYVGVVVSRAAMDLNPRIDGKLKSVRVKVGEMVVADQLLAQLDSDPIRRDLELARAGLLGARAGAKHARIALGEASEKSRRRLAVAADLSKEEVASAQAAERMGGAGLSVAEAAVAEQRARIAKLEETLGYTDLRAPFAGKIASIYAVAGALVGQKIPVLRLVQNQDLCVRFAVPAKQVAQLQVGKPVRFSLDTSLGELPGRVENISPEVDPGSQMGYVEASLDLPPELKAKIQPGLVARVRIAEDSDTDDNTRAWREAHP